MQNKDYKKKYMIINGNEIKRPTNFSKREFYCNDFETIYYNVGNETLDDIFESYNIPQEYRKVVFKVDFSLTAVLIEDYITKIGYDVTSVKRIKDKLFISGNTRHDVCNRISLETFATSYVNYEEMLAFFKKLKEAGLLKEYLNVILKFYKSDIELMDTEKEFNEKIDREPVAKLKLKKSRKK